MQVVRCVLVFLGLITLTACSAPQQFAAPAPVSTAAPSPALQPQLAQEPSNLSRSYTVYFDFDSAEIRASTMQVLWEAAQVANKLKPAVIRVHGFTDTVGNRAYNRKLSERRAAAVAAQLVKLGVRVASVETKGLGPDHPTIKSKGKGKRKHAHHRRVDLTFDGISASAALVGSGIAQIDLSPESPAIATAPDGSPGPAIAIPAAQIANGNACHGFDKQGGRAYSAGVIPAFTGGVDPPCGAKSPLT